MASGRLILRKIVKDKKVLNLKTHIGRLAFIYAVVHLDRDGRIEGDPTYLRNILFPRTLEPTVDEFEEIIKDWAENGLVEWYTVNGEKYLEFPGFRKNQQNMRYDREPASEIPPIPVSLPDEVRQSAGSPPDEVRQSAGSPPDEVRQSAGSLPDEVRQSAGSPPDEVRQSAGSPPDEVRQSAGSLPDEVRQSAGSPPDEVRQSAGSPPDEVRKQCGSLAAEEKRRELNTMKEKRKPPASFSNNLEMINRVKNLFPQDWDDSCEKRVLRIIETKGWKVLDQCLQAIEDMDFWKENVKTISDLSNNILGKNGLIKQSSRYTPRALKKKARQPPPEKCKCGGKIERLEMAINNDPYAEVEWTSVICKDCEKVFTFVNGVWDCSNLFENEDQKE